MKKYIKNGQNHLQKMIYLYTFITRFAYFYMLIIVDIQAYVSMHERIWNEQYMNKKIHNSLTFIFLTQPVVFFLKPSRIGLKA
jgi:hypothetical protein